MIVLVSSNKISLLDFTLHPPNITPITNSNKIIFAFILFHPSLLKLLKHLIINYIRTIF